MSDSQTAAIVAGLGNIQAYLRSNGWPVPDRLGSLQKQLTAGRVPGAFQSGERGWRLDTEAFDIGRAKIKSRAIESFDAAIASADAARQRAALARAEKKRAQASAIRPSPVQRPVGRPRKGAA